MSDPDRAAHWQSVYATKAETEVSWFQDHPDVSLELVRRSVAGPGSPIIDVGAGAARLADALLEDGFTDVTVLDIAPAAFIRTRERLGPRAAALRFVAADITRWQPDRVHDVWHDRAVFHFLTEAADRAAYRAVLGAALRPGGIAILGTFAPDGPPRCSGLPVMRYAPDALAAELGAGFVLLDSLNHAHHTPGGAVQHFQFSRFRRPGLTPG
ncbi:MAG TPA: class I SAM-dependent methyltransferase [Acetobacteraceae bacterium]|nr:class I SAM-dependent methyltransferase [Acetobacteraceae bacterium]